MPSPPSRSRSRRRARRGWGVGVMVLSMTGVTVVSGCTGSVHDPVRPSPFASLSASTGASVAASPVVLLRTAITDLLRRRAAALAGGDRTGFVGTVADPSSVAGRRQLEAYGAAQALQVSRFDVGTPVVDLVEAGHGTDGSDGSASATAQSAASSPSTAGSPGASPSTAGSPSTSPSTAGSPWTSPSTAVSPGASPAPGATRPLRATAQVDVRYRIDDLDRGDRVARLGYDLVRSADGWQVEAERPVGPGATVPWVAMPTLRVHRSAHAVVAGSVPDARLAEHAAVVNRALPGLRVQWPSTPGRVLVLAPSTAAEADALLGRASGSGAAPVAATTEGPTGAAGTATGDRVVLDPAAFGRLTASGRDVVLTHELAHVAVRASVPGRPAPWLAEGYADHVGYARADVPTRRLVAPLVSALRTGHPLRALPTAADLQPAAGDIEVPYLAAWQAVELIAAQHGEAALRELVTAGASTGSEADAEAATDRALTTVLGTTRAELTDAWLSRLGHLATNPG